ncbi:zincin-like metallopeptidase domain-containing protein [Bradyrhizobium diazoefficiens]|uniref:zincin-like metallopeptidase domain-containing protein n=1 Tax=Bradyrhizobium diazoefficiens TaxID=1355477 RepID=UPI001FCBFA79|nr:zincin-like metallopeptidase domain-containing protein [Bradyrhizobium diazoefficiens]
MVHFCARVAPRRVRINTVPRMLSRHNSPVLAKPEERTHEEGYATEELVAELSSAFVCAALGYSYNAAQSPAYIGGWLKVLKADSRAIVSL